MDIIIKSYYDYQVLMRIDGDKIDSWIARSKQEVKRILREVIRDKHQEYGG